MTGAVQLIPISMVAALCLACSGKDRLLAEHDDAEYSHGDQEAEPGGEHAHQEGDEDGHGGEAHPHAEHDEGERGEHAEHDEGEHDEHAGHEDRDERFVELSPGAASRVEIRTAKVVRKALAATLATTGRVDFDQDRLAHLNPRVSGRVHDITGILGQAVKKGTTLAVLDSIELGQAKADFLRSKAQLGLAKQTLEREEGLLADRITSEQAVAEAREAHQRALVGFQTAREQLRLLGLSKTQIAGVRYDDPAASLISVRAPIAGTVVEKHVSVGEMVTPGSNLFTIADLSRLWIWVDVFERDLGRVHLDDDVAVRVEAHPDRTLRGKVAYIRDQVDPATRAARARIDVDNREQLLKAGMFASVVLSDPHAAGGGERPEQLVVPSSAIQRDGEQSIAFVALGDNRFEKRVVTTSTGPGPEVAVNAGLEEGEVVVVEGGFLLKSESMKHSMGGGHSH